MFHSAKIRIKEGARRATRFGSAQQASSGAEQTEESTTTSSGDQSNMENFNHSKSGMANGKGPSSGRIMYDRMTEAMFNDPGSMMDVSDFDDNDGAMDLVDDVLFTTGSSMFGNNVFHHHGLPRRGTHKEHVDKVVHSDFFNKFDDLLDMDDLE